MGQAIIFSGTEVTNYMVIQSTVFPILGYRKESSGLKVKKLFGTGFFINTKGHFLTASHVIKDAFYWCKDEDQSIAVAPKQKNIPNPKSLTVPIAEYEFAPAEYDIAICRTEKYESLTFFDLESMEVGVWQNIATMGYPISYVYEREGEFRLQQRFKKGYIQRLIPNGRHQSLSNKPDLFEVNFPITKGMSGSPLFIHSKPNEKLIGVCIGSSQSEIVDYDHTEVLDGDKKYSEKKVRIVENGIADDIRPLLDWKPNILNGQTLEQIAKL